MSDTQFKFDSAIYQCKNWQSLKAKGLLSNLLSRSRVVAGERIPNETTYVFLLESNEVIITRDRHWAKEKTKQSWTLSRHEALVLEKRLLSGQYKL